MQFSTFLLTHPHDSWLRLQFYVWPAEDIPYSLGVANILNSTSALAVFKNNNDKKILTSVKQNGKAYGVTPCSNYFQTYGQNQPLPTSATGYKAQPWLMFTEIKKYGVTLPTMLTTLVLCPKAQPFF